MSRAPRSRPHDPRRLDIVAFAGEGAELSGHWAPSELGRLADASTTPPAGESDGGAVWQARGEAVVAVGRPTQTWLHLRAQARPWLTCQRCLQPVRCDLEVDTRIRFVPDEAAAERLDAESDFDVLASDRPVDLRELAEDELLLALPLVPRHTQCPQPLQVEGGEVAPGPTPVDAGQPHPFAALAVLKTGAKR